MKKNRNLILLLAIFLVLVGIYFGLKSWNENKDQREAEKAEEETIYVLEEQEMTALSYTDGESEMSFVREDDNWYYEGDKEIPMSYDAVESIADTIMSLTAVRELEDPDALEDYGLTEPAYTIEYVADSEENAVYVGNMAGENYYLTVGDTGKVYTVTSELISSLVFDLADVVDHDDVPSIGSGNLTQVDVTENGETVTYTEEDDLAQLAGGFGVLSLDTCADYHVTEETLADYGLDESDRITATATYTTTNSDDETENLTFTVYIGDVTSDEYQYVMVEGSKMVYQVSTSVVENMIVVSEEEVAEE